MNQGKLSKLAAYGWPLMTAAALTISMIGVGAGSAQAASTVWTLAQSPNAALSGGQIESVSCSSADACTAVGTNLDSTGINVTLAERWNGSSWQRQATPNPASDTDPSVAPSLLGVSCPTASFCAAVGQYTQGFTGAALAETWNGQHWTLQPFPVPADSAGAALTGVSCTSASFCEAVGSYFDNTTGANVTLAATWNGTLWSVQPTPNPADAFFEQLNTVSCTSATFCETWGSGNAGNPGPTVAEQWNGTSWQLQSVPSDATVNSVSCASAKFCEAVGSGSAYAWNGSQWSAHTIPGPAGSGSLGGVSCAVGRSCEAVGQYNNNGPVVGVAAVFKGSSWNSQATPNPAGATFTHLNAISCVSAKSCEAGGDFQVVVTANDPKALAEAWDGKAWQLQHAVAPDGATDNALRSVSCVSASFCVAVGSHFDSSGNEANLAEIWNGTTWRIQSVPNLTSQFGAVGNALLSVSCVSATFCEAVGNAPDGPSAAMWNGSSWTVALRPGPDVEPQALSCAAADFCMAAAGSAVDVWNGSAWATGPSVSGFSPVSSLSCLSASFCAAVGGGPPGENAAMWDGTSWSVVPTAGGVSAAPNAVWCTAVDSCEAVGQNFDQTSGGVVTFAEAWNGSTWSAQPTPNPAQTQGSSLAGVSCTSASSCSAAGQYQSSNLSTFGATQTLVEVWDGTAWTLRSTPNPSPVQDLLSGVSCGASQECTAVGQAEDVGNVPATLIETGD
jgi:hypothetical protein